MTLQEIIRLTDEVGMLDKLIADLEKEAASLAEKRKHIANTLLPDAMNEAGIAEVVSSEGQRFKLKEFYAASITEARRDAAHSWLREHGHGGIIKNEVVIKPANHEAVEQVCTELTAMNVPYTTKEAIHHATLRSFVNEEIESGRDFPKELFGAVLIREVKVSG